MAAELDPLSGDVAGLIDYRRTPAGMVHTTSRPGCVHLEFRIIPPTAEQHQVWRQLELDLNRAGMLGPHCPTCWSPNPHIMVGPSVCPDSFHDPEPEDDWWKRMTWRVFAILAVLAWIAITIAITSGR